jgi:anaerobic carbon-monoxide dehydrogenase catalytic subunit
VTPRGIDRETSEMMHRTHMGVDNGWVSLLLQAVRNALSDGWGGSMIATDVSDILYGTPKPVQTSANMGVLKADHVNIIVHGHNPVVSEMILLASQDPIFWLCQIQRRRGYKSGRALLYGKRAVDATWSGHGRKPFDDRTGDRHGCRRNALCRLSVYYAVFGKYWDCYHTKMISTSDKARFPNMEHHEFHPDNAADLAKTLVTKSSREF